MALPKASDSMTRCDPNLYSNIYTLQARPDFRPELVTSTKDTIEISRDKLRSDAMRNLKEPIKFVIAQQSFMRIGKYLFLALVFPPYLMVYKIPKWIIVEAYQTLLSFSTWVWKRVKQTTKPKIEVAARRLTALLQFIKKTNRILFIQPMVNLALAIRNRMTRFRGIATYFFYTCKNRIIRPFSQLKAMYKETVKAMLDGIDAYKAKIKQMSQRALKSIQWKAISRQLLDWSRLQSKGFGEKIQALSARLGNPLQFSQQMANRATSRFFALLKKEAMVCKKELQPIFSYIRKGMRALSQPFLSFAARNFKKMRDFFQEGHRRTAVFLQNSQDKIKKLSKRQFEHHWIKKLPARGQSWLRKLLFHPFTQMIVKRAVNFYCQVASPIVQAASYTTEKIGVVAELVCKKATDYQARWVEFRYKALQMLFLCEQKVIRFFWLGIYYTLLTSIMIGIISVWSTRAIVHLLNSYKLKWLD